MQYKKSMSVTDAMKAEKAKRGGKKAMPKKAATTKNKKPR